MIQRGKCIQIICIFFHQSFHQGFGQSERNVGLFEYQNGEAHELQHANPQIFLFFCTLHVDFKERTDHLHPSLFGKVELLAQLQRFYELGCTVLSAEEKFSLFVESFEQGECPVVGVSSLFKDLHEHVGFSLRN